MYIPIHYFLNIKSVESHNDPCDTWWWCNENDEIHIVSRLCAWYSSHLIQIQTESMEWRGIRFWILKPKHAFDFDGKLITINTWSRSFFLFVFLLLFFGRFLNSWREAEMDPHMKGTTSSSYFKLSMLC